MSHDPPLLDRVRKLLALATSPNIHEATAAAALAQTLIARHRLQTWLDADQTVADDPEPIEDARDTPLEASKRLRTWKTVLANALAEYQTRYRDWRELFRQLAKVDKVTKADIRRVANQVFLASNRTSAEIDTETASADRKKDGGAE